MESPPETETIPLNEEFSNEINDAGDGGATEEDLPSDFFDEFSKEEFIEGLSIIDSWDEGANPGGRFHDAKNIDSENEQELLTHVSGSADDLRSERSRNKSKLIDSVKGLQEFLPHKTSTSLRYEKKWESRSPDTSRLDDFIKPGSRRDPNKTNEAIKKDKEEKVKEYLAKSLESSDDLRPPGTELDDYFDEHKQIKKENTPMKRSRSREPQSSQIKSSYRMRESPARVSRQSKWSPKPSPRRFSPPRRSPGRPSYKRPFSPQKYPRPNYKRYSPFRSSRRPSPRRVSPRRISPRRLSPRRVSPRRSPRRYRRSRSRSPYKRSHESQQSRSPSSKKHMDRFLYPTDSDIPPAYNSGLTMNAPYMGPGAYPGPSAGDFLGSPNYSYAPAYGGSFNNSNQFEYGGPPPIQNVMSIPTPNPVPAPIPLPNLPLPPNPSPAPMMVPAPNMVSPLVPQQTPVKTQAKAETPYDALAKLVAEGKISRQDYLKLAPNKGASSGLENNHRVVVLQRCNNAIKKLSKLHLPNHLLLHNSMLDGHSEVKYIAPKYCSPLKRQVPIEFLFTKANIAATAQQNKHLVDSIIASLPELEKVITRAKKKAPKNMKDAAVQTSKPYCEVCEIRENTQFHSASTSIDLENFCSTVHTQVVEQDLMNSKSVFNPSGSVGDSASMSIAHLTPAQLVSQLAARAKTLKQPDAPVPNQYKRNPSNNYDYDYEGRGGGQQYQNYNNYRY